MRREVWALLGIAGAAWLAYMVWLTGYQSGYEDGANTAWQNARAALAPQLSAREPAGDAVRLER